jgi:hypothetical protein
MKKKYVVTYLFGFFSALFLSTLVSMLLGFVPVGYQAIMTGLLFFNFAIAAAIETKKAT